MCVCVCFFSEAGRAERVAFRFSEFLQSSDLCFQVLLEDEPSGLLRRPLV